GGGSSSGGSSGGSGGSSSVGGQATALDLSGSSSLPADADAPSCVETPELDLRVRQIANADADRQFRFQVTNNGSLPIDLDDVSVRFWVSEAADLATSIYVAPHLVGVGGQLRPASIASSASVRDISAGCSSETDEVQVSFSGGELLQPGESMTNVLVSLRRSDWGHFDDVADYSPLPAYQNGATHDVTWPDNLGQDAHYGVYYRGRHVSEVLGDGSADPHAGQEPLCVANCLFGEEEIGKFSADVQSAIRLPDGLIAQGYNIQLGTAGQAEAVLAYVRTVGGAVDVFSDYGARLLTMTPANIAEVVVPLTALRDLVIDSRVERVELATKLEEFLDESTDDLMVAEAHAGVAGCNGATGQGVLVGVIDSGVDPNHPAFSGRLERLWDMQSQANASLAWVGQSTVANSGFQDSGHGTLVLGAAAGVDPNGVYSGVAVDADLAVAAVNGSLSGGGVASIDDFGGSLISAADWIFQSRGTRPAVVNFSVGNHWGPHDGTSLMAEGLDALVGPGQVIVAAAANDGAQNFHLNGTTAASGKTRVNFQTERYGYHRVEFWIDGYVTAPKIEVLTPVSSTVFTLSSSNPTQALGSSALSYGLAWQELPGGARRTNVILVIQNQNINNVLANWRIDLDLDGLPPTNFHAWTSKSGATYDPFPSGERSGTVAIPGVAKKVITVGSYVTDPNCSFLSQNCDENYRGLSAFSSRGPTVDGRLKPEITAPGERIVSARSSADLRNAPIDGDWARVQGTSFSAPQVAGIVALLLEKDPTLSGADALAELIDGRKIDRFTGTSASLPNNDWGHGKAHALGSLASECGQTVCYDNFTPRIDYFDVTSNAEGWPFELRAEWKYYLILRQGGRELAKIDEQGTIHEDIGDGDTVYPNPSPFEVTSLVNRFECLEVEMAAGDVWRPNQTDPWNPASSNQADYHVAEYCFNQSSGAWEASDPSDANGVHEVYIQRNLADNLDFDFHWGFDTALCQ
ncbi:MAG: S8 family serine peptidase, partial [Polyangiaceae bacterium]|nr:S8 family serine peptidase [Polyangiaceae bacterium]